MRISIKNLVYCVFLLCAALGLIREYAPMFQTKEEQDNLIRYYRATAADFARQAQTLSLVSAGDNATSRYKACVAATRAAWYSREVEWYGDRAAKLSAATAFDCSAERALFFAHEREAYMSLVAKVAAACDAAEGADGQALN